MVGVQGFEPRQAESESAVLPLDDTPMTAVRQHVETLPESSLPPQRQERRQGTAAITAATGTGRRQWQLPWWGWRSR